MTPPGRLPDPELRSLRRLYDLGAPFYDSLRKVWVNRRAEAELDRLFAARIQPGCDVLELAPGTGINAMRLQARAPHFRSYLGIDASAAMLARARRRVAGDPRFRFELGDARDLSGLDQHYGFIVCSWLLAHLARPADVVHAALERLAPGGTAAFLFLSPPERALHRHLLRSFAALFHGRPLAPHTLADHPNLESLHPFPPGHAHLALFHQA